MNRLFRNIWLMRGLLVLGLVYGQLTWAADVVRKSVNENGLVADLIYTSGKPPNKALLLLGGGEGGRIWSSEMLSPQIEQLLAQGYVVMSLAYFGEAGLPEQLRLIDLAYFDKAIRWLKHQPQVDRSSGVGIIGFSMGAQAAMLTAMHNENVQALVSISGPSHISQALVDEHVSAWQRNERELPHLYMAFDEVYWNAVQTGNWAAANDKALLDKKVARHSMVKLEQANAPILLLAGAQDQTWDSVKMANTLAFRLKDEAYDYPYEVQHFPGGHGVIVENPESWQAVLAFLAQHYPASHH